MATNGRRERGAGGRSGFTLTEIAVVVAIIGMAGAMAVSNAIARRPLIELNSAQGRVATDLRRARMQAVAENRNVRVTFAPANRRYTIWSDRNGNGVVDAGEMETRLLTDLRNLTMYASPTVGTFTPQGTYLTSHLYGYVCLQTPAGWRYIYTFPSGQVDPYQYN